MRFAMRMARVATGSPSSETLSSRSEFGLSMSTRVVAVPLKRWGLAPGGAETGPAMWSPTTIATTAPVATRIRCRPSVRRMTKNSIRPIQKAPGRALLAAVGSARPMPALVLSGPLLATLGLVALLVVGAVVAAALVTTGVEAGGEGEQHPASACWGVFCVARLVRVSRPRVRKRRRPGRDTSLHRPGRSTSRPPGRSSTARTSTA